MEEEAAQRIEIAKGIFRTPGVCGGRARIRNMRITVSFLENYRRIGKTEGWILDNYPGLTPEDLRNAWAYVAAYRDEMEREIAEYY
jgi:uncharacterized protein (DUF433 family)